MILATVTLSVPEILKPVAPNAQPFHLITRNIDRLSVDALLQELRQQNLSPSISKNSIIEMHGNYSRPNAPILTAAIAPKICLLLLLSVQLLNRLHFLVAHLADLLLVLELYADMCLAIGTSTVLPEATYAHRVRRHNGKVAVYLLGVTQRQTFCSKEDVKQF
ncbi:unnamed protein product [Cyclocybe aegerita]|uniref:Uncharacterized protein n=1 Tax=Cyclocybe aegerita TaxID=1973307 RepID=A0A8S0W2R6_CYCAE|nr:unnamed protein product [Cyclocybe aegerita]